MARRPLKSRDSRLAVRVAAWLAGRGVSPNRISQLSILFAALAGAAFWGAGAAEGAARVLLLLAAALGCQMRLACNLLDGMVAVEGGRAEPDGAFWNEVPDRLADILVLTGMGLAVDAPALGWAAACLAVSTAYLREFGTAQGLAADFSGPMAKPHRMAAATVAALVALVWMPALLWGLAIVAAGTAWTAARRAVRIVVAMRARKTNNEGDT